ncbi:MAG: hypothetical protein HFE66_07710 [Clostridiales bacterium]|jgi:hypothetical protein|nr:hypothetical protein [Clostridiales bacterium]
MRDMVGEKKKSRAFEGMGTPVKKLMLNQFGGAMLGIMLSSATMQSDTLNLLTSILAIFFYLFLQYTAVWEIGAKDQIRVNGGRAAENKWQGLRIALLANGLNIILGVLAVILTTIGVLTQWKWAGEGALLSTVAARFWQGMYNGVINFIIPVNLKGVQTILSSLIYLAIIVPSLVVNTIGYRMGYMNRRIFPERKKEK